MAKQPAKNANISINSVALEDDIDNFKLSVTQEIPVTTGLSTTGPTRVVGNYDYGVDVGGAADFAASQSDATLHGLVGSTGVAVSVDPTGSSAGTDDPNYDSTSMVLESYEISGQLGGRIDFSASLKGNSALSRATS